MSKFSEIQPNTACWQLAPVIEIHSNVLVELEQYDWTLFDPLTDKFGECEAPSFQKLRFSLSALALP